jgi:hypothetical protein
VSSEVIAPACIGALTERWLEMVECPERAKPAIGRFRTDKRMQHVWPELTKWWAGDASLSRNDAHIADSMLPDATLSHFERALLWLANAAIWGWYWGDARFGAMPHGVVTQAEINRRQQFHRERAVRLEAEIRLAQHTLGIQDTITMRDLEAIVARDRRLANWNPADFGYLVVPRDTGNLALRGYLMQLVGVTQKYFNHPLLRTIATIASVVLDEEVTPGMVRVAAAARGCVAKTVEGEF